MKPTVLDASALLAMFFGEPGMEQMRELFHKASEADQPVFISAVNWAEVLYQMERKRGKAGYDTARQFEVRSGAVGDMAALLGKDGHFIRLQVHGMHRDQVGAQQTQVL